jgi:hypothetical protein
MFKNFLLNISNGNETLTILGIHLGLTLPEVVEEVSPDSVPDLFEELCGFILLFEDYFH